MLLANISLRPSCYNCRFKEMPKCAFEKILPNLQYKECSLDCAVSPDAESRQKIRKHPNRKRFFKKLDDDSIEELMCYMKASILTRGVYKVARKLGIHEKQSWNCIETNIVLRQIKKVLERKTDKNDEVGIVAIHQRNLYADSNHDSLSDTERWYGSNNVACGSES